MPPAVAPPAARPRWRCAPRAARDPPHGSGRRLARVSASARPRIRVEDAFRRASPGCRCSLRFPTGSLARGPDASPGSAPRASRVPPDDPGADPDAPPRRGDDRRGRDRGHGRGGRPRARQHLVVPLPRERHGGRDPTPGGRRALGLGRLRRRRGRRRAVQDAPSGRVPRRRRRRRRLRLVVLRRGRRPRRSRLGPSPPPPPPPVPRRRSHLGHRRRRRDPPAPIPIRPRPHRRRRVVRRRQLVGRGQTRTRQSRRRRRRGTAPARSRPSRRRRSPRRRDRMRRDALPPRPGQRMVRRVTSLSPEERPGEGGAGDATGVVDGWRVGRFRFLPERRRLRRLRRLGLGTRRAPDAGVDGARVRVQRVHVRRGARVFAGAVSRRTRARHVDRGVSRRRVQSTVAETRGVGGRQDARAEATHPDVGRFRL